MLLRLGRRGEHTGNRTDTQGGHDGAGGGTRSRLLYYIGVCDVWRKGKPTKAQTQSDSKLTGPVLFV